MSSLAPKDAAVYLEIKDLSQTLNALTVNRIFQENSADKPNFSTLENIQAAVVINGFDASEKQVSDDNSILDLKPKFVAIADTHRWNSSAVAIAESQIGKFAQNLYGSDVELETFEKSGAKFFVWTSRGGHKLFSAVSDSVIYVGNNETLLEKCLAVKRGEAESLIKNEKFIRSLERRNLENLVAFGYVSPEGVKQFADIAGISAAAEAEDEAIEKNLIARILPRILQNTTEEIVWTARKTEGKIEDDFFISLNDETARIFRETLASTSPKTANADKYLPADIFGVTSYNLANPSIAWRSLLLVTARSIDPTSGKYLVQYSNQLLAPYGISNAQMFLNAVDSEISTVQFDSEGTGSAVVAEVKDAAQIKKSIADIDFESVPVKNGNARIWKSKNGEIIAAFIENKFILGDAASVLKCLQARRSGQNFTPSQSFQRFAETPSTAVTFGKNPAAADKIVLVLGKAKLNNPQTMPEYFTLTRFTEVGIERKTISDFGFLGTLLEQISINE